MDCASNRLVVRYILQGNRLKEMVMNLIISDSNESIVETFQYNSDWFLYLKRQS